MCGIAGILISTETGPADVDRVVRSMIGALKHRGPDDTGAWSSRAAPGAVVGFGHARLRVIDLSTGGAQPMTRGPLTITYNGEITNYQELRAQLSDAGVTFSSASDTEVLLGAWQRWGSDALDHLDGMFAFALWDAADQRLWLARDRFGIKPLYVATTGSTLVFASEVRGLLASGLVDSRLDERSLGHYLAYQTAATPATLIRGVQMLEPGHVMSVTATGQTTTRRYWSLLEAASAFAAPIDAAAASREIADRLSRAVSSHLASDVPLGVFLSGGLDSGAILSVLHAHGVHARTFTVAVVDAPDADESAEARLTAEAFGSDHTEIRLTGDELSARLPDALAAVDHPSADGINSFIVSQAVRSRGMTVALSGLGGDEIFAGYPSFDRLARVAPAARQWKRAPLAVRRAAADVLRSAAGQQTKAAKAAAMLESDGSVAELWPITRELFPAAERDCLLRDSARTPDACVAFLNQMNAEWPDADLFAQISCAESRLYMHDVLLRDTDQMSMAHGLEVRVPLLDHHLASYVVSLPDALKRRGHKALLADNLPRRLPAAVRNLAKRGFSLPFDTWMRGPLRPFCQDALGHLEARGVFRPGSVNDLWTRFLGRSPSATWPRVWSLVALESWLERQHVRVT